MEPTIESLERVVWPEPEWQSGLVLTAHALRKKPIDELTANDLRVALNEDIGTDFIKARIVDVLEADPIAGDLFDGDLVVAALKSRLSHRNNEFRTKTVRCAELALVHDLDERTRDEIRTLKNA